MKTPIDISDLTIAEIQQLIKELQVRQTELEKQNEKHRPKLPDLKTTPADRIQPQQLHFKANHKDETEGERVVLSESAERYRWVLEDASVLICSFLPDGEITYVNKAYCDYYAKTSEELIGSIFLLLIPEFERETVLANILALTIESPIQSHEHQVIMPNGDVHWQHWTNRALFDAQGSVVSYQSIGDDITERKLAEEALKKSKQQAHEANLFLQMILDLSPEIISYIDKDFKYQYANDKYQGIFGIDPSSMIGVHPKDVLGKEVYENIAPRLEAAFSGETVVFETEFYLPNGELRYFYARFIPHFRESEVVGLLNIVQDITGIKRTEAFLQQLNQAIQQSPLSVMITDAEGAIQYINPKFTEITGYSEAEVIGQNPRILKSGEHPPEFYQELWDSITNGEEWQREIHNRRKNGALYWELNSIAGVKEPGGKITHFVAVKEDITERKQREKEHVRQERLAAVGQLAAGIAHDFNNVMAVITLYADLLLSSSNFSADQTEKIKIIKQQAIHASDLTQQILDFSRRSIQEPQSLDLKALLKEMLKFVERTIPENVQIDFDFPDGDYKVNADPAQLQQAITNITINARDAMPEGGSLNLKLIRLKLRAGEKRPCANMANGEWIKLIISDSGIGIAPEAVPHIFEPFFTTKEVGKGTGLGLAQVYGIVQQHEGCITVASKLGEGSAFTIYLPALETAVPNITSPSTIPQGHGETILLVEDNKVLLEATRTVLESLNYDVCPAENGEVALDIYRSRPNNIQLILADVMMPKLDGFELVKMLQQQSPPPKVILMSGFPKDLGLLAEMKQFVGGWISKPLNVRKLAETLRDMLD
ncbi:MAG: PAS domain S-box protein [Chloroflexi bacterium]|nr:MAG: PAS domain S-box protein [Chloroflexota bacterium]